MISASESALALEKISAGKFGFTHSYIFKTGSTEIERFPNGRLSFEIHKPSLTDAFAIAFVNADAKRSIEIRNVISQPVTLYSDYWPDAPYAVRVEVSSCGDAVTRIVTLDDKENVVAVDCMPRSGKK